VNELMNVTIVVCWFTATVFDLWECSNIWYSSDE